MGRLVYSAIMSLDGYVTDAADRFDWAVPDEQVHAAVNEVMRPIGTHLYGRRLYEVMAGWETMDVSGASVATQDFAALWRDSDKVVYSSRVETVATPRTRIERTFEVAAVASVKASATRDLLVGGPTLAGQALVAGLVDDLHLFVVPVVVGGGTRALPHLVQRPDGVQLDGQRLDLRLVDERRFGSGVVHLQYAVHLPAPSG
jgi:dihydrofolate reductase